MGVLQEAKAVAGQAQGLMEIDPSLKVGHAVERALRQEYALHEFTHQQPPLRIEVAANLLVHASQLPGIPRGF